MQNNRTIPSKIWRFTILEGNKLDNRPGKLQFFWKELSFLLNRTDDLPLPKCIWFKKTRIISLKVVTSYLYLVQLYANDTAFLDSFWLPHCLRKGVAHIRKCEELQNKRLLLIPIHKPAHWGLVVSFACFNFDLLLLVFSHNNLEI